MKKTRSTDYYLAKASFYIGFFNMTSHLISSVILLYLVDNKIR